MRFKNNFWLHFGFEKIQVGRHKKSYYISTKDASKIFLKPLSKAPQKIFFKIKVGRHMRSHIPKKSNSAWKIFLKNSPPNNFAKKSASGFCKNVIKNPLWPQKLFFKIYQWLVKIFLKNPPKTPQKIFLSDTSKIFKKTHGGPLEKYS